ncbi:general transcription factor 3C polypeptide 1 isoform X1 [Andrena cerasifolii]|uniref:general transcription factor 3C polypeptide 1 isoform X1 n=2 Tax=Andrena cerasifolii TaxID=2819439 RepID=UPI004037B8F7
MVSYPSINLVDLIIDEVALEGLDGITIEALWLRLAHRMHYTLPLPKPFMVQIWSLCVQIREFAFYELQTAREPFVIFDRYEFVDPDLGIILEPDNVPPDIYPHCPIYDVSNGIKGSCSTYYTRKEATETVRSLGLDDAIERYGQKLVIVASQSARNHALIGDEVSPTVELNAMQYCFLERVGRSRYHGEVTQGKLSLNALKEDPKSLFYHRKLLLRYKLITKQIHHQKSGGHSCNGSLLHLPRFFVERKQKAIFLAEEVIKILKSKPNCVAEYDEIKRKLQIENAIRKLFKTSFFQKVVKTDIRVPYRTLYPNATSTEWRQKNNPLKEKKIKVVQLLLPTIDVVEAWNKEDIPVEDEVQELNISSHKYSVPYLKQANEIIEDGGDAGICQGSLSKKMGLTKLQSRTILRNIVKSGIVATYMNDMGRQRLTKYVSKRFEKGSALSKQFNKEMHKIKELTKQIVTENDDFGKSTSNTREDRVEAVSADQERNLEEITNSSKTSDGSESNSGKSNRPAVELQNIFHVVNRILYKYRLIKRPNRYKRTFPNFQASTSNKAKAEGKDTNSNNTSQASELSCNEKAISAYKNIKVDMIVLTPMHTDKSDAEVFGFMENVQNSEKKSIGNITYRLLRRANMIIESVKENQVIDDMTKLMKLIHEEEDKEGYDVKIDKKSLQRLLQKLAKDNLVKNIKIILTGFEKEKHLTFICDPSVDINSAIIQSAVEQAKLKFYLLLSQKPRLPTKKYTDKVVPTKSTSTDDAADKAETKSLLKQFKTQSAGYKCGPKESKKYGYSPKFIRMQAFHFYLFYLAYEHPGEPTISKEEQIQALRNNDFKITDELAEEFSTIYTKDISWKMFVPPLPKYNGWPKGWMLMCDVLLRLPLSVFLKIHFVSFAIPDLDKYVNHPIRKHYLVRDLPIDARNSLLFARKYIFNIHETVTRLCYIGLVQFGPQRLKEKDQVFVYVNRRAELMDTTSSAPGYHIIEDKPYPLIKYNFNSTQAVEKYWYDMWNTCINTPLGGRLVVQGKEIVLEDLAKKSAMMEVVVARSPEEAVKLDTGHLPGDRKGAAGIDSACFPHLKRNWNWGFGSNARQIKSQQNVANERDTYLSKIKAKPIKFTEFPGLKRVSGPLSVNATDLRRKVHAKNEEGSIQQRKYEALTCCRSAKQKSYVRRVLPRKASSKKRNKYDEVDYRALQRMHKLRVDWDQHEDKILLVCKVAMVYLCPNPRKQVLTFSAVRDILRTYSLSSHNKTSRACQRRLLYMLRQQQNVNAIALGVEEIKQNFYIRKRFDGILERLKEEYKCSYEYDKYVVEVFRSLVAYIAKKYYDISHVEEKEPLLVPATVQEFNILYKVVHPAKPFGNRGFTKDARNTNDIHFAVINSVIHSSMCCGKDRRSWAYQLFKVYQQYPEMLLRNAMAKIRSDQMVTIKKHQITTIRKYGNYMPMSSSQYQLSSNYIYKFHTKWPYNIFKEAYDVFFKLSTWHCQSRVDNESETPSDFNGIEVSPITGGVIAAIHDYAVRDQIDFDIEIPDQVIMLDPRLKERDETYFRIAKRYQDVLVILDNLKFVKDPSFQNDDTASDFAQKSDKGFSSDVDILYENDTNMRNADANDKDGFSDLDAEKNILPRGYGADKRNFEDTKSFAYYDDIIFESDEENGRNIVDDEQNVIKFQDGTTIVLNKDDMERSALCDEDSAMETVEGETASASDNSRTIESEVQAQSIKATEPVEPAGASQAQSSDGTQGIKGSVSSCLESDMDAQELNVHGEKRARDDEASLDSDERVQKRAKLDNEVTVAGDDAKNEEALRSSDVVPTGLSDQIQTECLRKHSDDKADESSGANLNDMRTSNGEDMSNKKCEVTLSSRKNKPAFTRVSSILKSIPFEQNYSSRYGKIDDSADVTKRYTRIALLRMREELSELTVADSHHAHEYFVVNMFKVFYTLHTSPQKSREKEIFKGFMIPLELLPLKLNAVNDLIQEINKFAIFPNDSISYCDFKKNLPKDLPLNLNDIEAVYKFVRDKKELGASIQELMNKFQSNLGEDLYRITSFLTENRLFLRSGVMTVRYIHHRHADSWLIRSYKIYRLEKESLAPMPQGTVYDVTEPEIIITEDDVNMTEEATKNATVESELPSTKCENPVELDTQSEVKSHKNENSDKEASNHSDEECATQTKKRMQRKRTRLLPQRDISRAAKQLDLTTKQEIRVVIKPWIRIDGVLNRRVLDRMLGAVLSYCLTHPGIALTKVQNRFVPALQPCHTRELVEMLGKLGCLEKIILRKPHVSLFSKPSQVKPIIANNDWAPEEDIFLEATTGAMLKFGVFLSTKMYSTDYIS